MSKKNKSKSKANNDDVSLSDMIAAENELQNLKELEKARNGTADEPIPFKKDPIGWILSAKDRRTKVRINKKTYLKLCILGAFGAHRFYAHQYVVGIIYLLLCWTGLSIANTIIDIFVIIPMEADEEGYVVI